MQIKIKVGRKYRIFPDDYIPEDQGNKMYKCKLAEDPNQLYEYVVQSSRGTLPMLLPQPEHDPVFLVLRDLFRLNSKLSTLSEISWWLSILATIAVYDQRGYIKPQLSQIEMALKLKTEIIDYESFFNT